MKTIHSNFFLSTATPHINLLSTETNTWQSSKDLKKLNQPLHPLNIKTIAQNVTQKFY